eukprot:TRINITY_DN38046_c1_g1_i1.p1 TRINITY_DN38046_c1_g1~~TRINITY_DN38046_c1_g1_i1.p1  ORF type:complete len:170 (+),score=8.39 TRINITY_DN38046_c1_g1_i1:110-619(+)
MGSSRTEFQERLFGLAQVHEEVLVERDTLRSELRRLRDQVSLGFSSGLDKPLEALPAAAADVESPSLLRRLVSTDAPHQCDELVQARHVPARQNSELSDNAVWFRQRLEVQVPGASTSSLCGIRGAVPILPADPLRPAWKATASSLSFAGQRLRDFWTLTTDPDIVEYW